MYIYHKAYEWEPSTIGGKFMDIRLPFKYTNEFSLSALGMEDKDREWILMKRRLGVKQEWCVWDSNSYHDVWCPYLLDVKILVKF